MSAERSIAILSPGLLGGSLIKAILQRMPGAEIRVWARRQQAVDEVRAAFPSVVATTDVAEALKDASLAILCMPVQHMEEIAQRMVACTLAQDLLVTDVGSVKGAVVAGMEPVFAATRAVFIGSHPMAGSEKTGLAHASGDLFYHAACLITPSPTTPRPLVERLRNFWTRLGCRVREMTPQAHDRCVARISHLPHAMAVLTTLAALHDDTDVLDSSAGGFRDTTRVAGGDPAMWAGIFLNNRAEIIAALEDAATAQRELVEMLRSMDEEALRRFLARAKALRDLLPAV